MLCLHRQPPLRHASECWWHLCHTERAELLLPRKAHLLLQEQWALGVMWMLGAHRQPPLRLRLQRTALHWSSKRRRLVASVPLGGSRTSATKEGALVVARTMGFGRHVDARHTSPAFLAAGTRRLVASVPHGGSQISAIKAGALVAARTMVS